MLWVTRCRGRCPSAQKMSPCGLAARCNSLMASSSVLVPSAWQRAWLYTNIPMRSSSPSIARFAVLRGPGTRHRGRPKAAGTCARRTAKVVRMTAAASAFHPKRTFGASPRLNHAGRPSVCQFSLDWEFGMTRDFSALPVAGLMEFSSERH